MWCKVRQLLALLGAPPAVLECLHETAGVTPVCQPGSCSILQGYNLYSRLGDGSTTNRWSPTPVAFIDLWLAVSTGTYHACGIRSEGSLYCWVSFISLPGEGGQGEATANPGIAFCTCRATTPMASWATGPWSQGLPLLKSARILTGARLLLAGPQLAPSTAMVVFIAGQVIALASPDISCWATLAAD